MVRLRQMQQKAKATRSQMEAVIKGLERQVSELEEAKSFLLGVKDSTDSMVVQPIRKLTQKKSKIEATYVMLASDWHMGERIRPEVVRNQNEYTPEIAQERAHKFFRSNLRMLRASRSAWDTNQLVLWLGGDLMSGYIHEELEEENFLSPTEEAVLVFDTMVSGINYILAEYDVRKIRIVTSNGNHGRTGKKKKIASNFRNSYEFMVYRLLAKHFEKEKRITWQLGQGYNNMLDIYGCSANFSHGDAIRSNGGIGGIAPALYRRIGRMQEHGTRVDIYNIGHFHQLQFPRLCAINGSLIGFSPFAEFIGASPEPPMQGSYIVDSKHNVPCNFNPIFVS